MGRDIDRIFEEFHACEEPEIFDDIRVFLGMDDLIETCHIEVDESNKIFVNVMLKKFSYLAARHIFLGLTEFLRRSYYNVYAGEELGERMRYLFLTGMPGKDGIKLEVVIG